MFSVSYMTTENDYGHCLSFWNEEAAQAFLNECLNLYYHAEMWDSVPATGITALVHTHNARGFEL